MQQNQYENLKQTFEIPSLKADIQISFNFEFVKHINGFSNTSCKCSHMTDIWFMKISSALLDKNVSSHYKVIF